MQRDRRWFDEPESFRPERWAGDLAQRLPRFAYFPFGGGPRQCIGNSFAQMEAVLILATIAQRFRLSLVPGQRITPTPTSRCARSRASACSSRDGNGVGWRPWKPNDEEVS